MKKLLVAGLVLSVAGGVFASVKTPNLGRTAQSSNTTLTASTGNQSGADHAPFTTQAEPVVKETVVVHQDNFGSVPTFESAAHAEYYELKINGLDIPESLRLEVFGNQSEGNASRDGGDTMGEAVEIPFVAGSVWTDSGTTVGFADDLVQGMEFPVDCNTSSYSVSFGGPDVFYSFTLPDAYEVSASVCDAATYDTCIGILDASGVLVAMNDDGAGCADYSSLLDPCCLPAGDYYLVVDSYGADEGDYDLTVEFSDAVCGGGGDCEEIVCEGADEAEPNNGPADFGGDDTYGAIDCEGTVCGTTWADGGNRDTDWFELTLAEDQILTVTAEVEDFDALIFIIDDAYNIVTSADENGVCEGESIVSTCLFAGTYYLWMGVNAFEGVPEEQAYALSVSCAPCEIDDPCDDPVVLSCGDDYTGSTIGMQDFVNNPAPDYFFQIDIDADGPVTFSLCDGGTDYDSYLTLWDDCPVSGGVMIASNDDACGLQSEIVTTLSAGTYWLVVDGYSENEGNFSLVVSCSTCDPITCEGDDEGEPNNGPADFGGDDTFGAIDCGTTICGTTWADGGNRDTDWFELVLLEDSYLNIDSQIEMFDALVFIIDDAYNVVTTIDNGSFCDGESYDGQAAGDCMSAGIYYLWMGHNGFEGVAEEQAYALSLTCVPCEWIDPCDAAIAVSCGDLVMGSNDDSQAGNVWEEYCNGGEDGPEVLYELTHDGGFLTINMTSDDASDLDLVLMGSCDPLDCLEMPWAVGPNETISGVYDAGTYYIVVDCWGYADEDYTYTLEIECGDDPCEGLVPVDCVGTPEVEPNEGWNDDPPNNSYGTIALEETVCGTVWADGGNRDLDWYQYIHEGGDVYVGAGIDEFDCILFLTDFSPDGAVITSADNAAMCVGETLEAPGLAAGEYYIVIAHNAFEGVAVDQNYGLTVSATPVDVAVDPILVSGFELYTNFPNPFNPTTTISWSQPELTQATLTVFNILGEKVNTFDLGVRTAGVQSFVWDASMLSSGVYIYTLQAGNFTSTQKAVLLK